MDATRNPSSMGAQRFKPLHAEFSCTANPNSCQVSCASVAQQVTGFTAPVPDAVRNTLAAWKLSYALVGSA